MYEKNTVTMLKEEFDIVPTKRQTVIAEGGRHVLLGHFKRPGWRGKLPFYLFKCPIHGLVYDYPHGFWDFMKGTIPVKVNGVLSQLYCPICEADRILRNKMDMESGSVELR